MDRIGGLLGALRALSSLVVPRLDAKGRINESEGAKREPPDPKIAPLVAQHNQLMQLTHLNLTSPKPSLAIPSPPATPLQYDHNT